VGEWLSPLPKVLDPKDQESAGLLERVGAHHVSHRKGIQPPREGGGSVGCDPPQCPYLRGYISRMDWSETLMVCGAFRRSEGDGSFCL